MPFQLTRTKPESLDAQVNEEEMTLFCESGEYTSRQLELTSVLLRRC